MRYREREDVQIERVKDRDGKTERERGREKEEERKFGQIKSQIERSFIK